MEAGLRWQPSAFGSVAGKNAALYVAANLPQVISLLIQVWRFAHEVRQIRGLN